MFNLLSLINPGYGTGASLLRHASLIWLIICREVEIRRGIEPLSITAPCHTDFREFDFTTIKQGFIPFLCSTQATCLCIRILPGRELGHPSSIRLRILILSATHWMIQT